MRRHPLMRSLHRAVRLTAPADSRAERDELVSELAVGLLKRGQRVDTTDYQVVEWATLDAARRRRRFRRPLPRGAGDSWSTARYSPPPSRMSERRHRRRRTLAALYSLPTGLRRTGILAIWGDLPERAIAKRLGTSSSTINRRIRRIHQFLIEHLGITRTGGSP